jgi:hypothetical protein
MSYRKVDTRIWNDAKFISLSDDARMVVFLLLTHDDMTMIGAMKTTAQNLADDMRWKLPRFQKAFDEVLRKGIAEFDADGRFLCLPNFLRYNNPQSPNVVKAWGKAFDKLPDCDLKQLTAWRCHTFLKGMAKAFQEALPEALAKACREALLNQKLKLKLELSYPGKGNLEKDLSVGTTSPHEGENPECNLKVVA